MRKQIILIATIVVCVCCVFSIGCKKGGLQGLVPLSGTVTYNGEPVEGAQITFAPDDAANGRSALAKTEADGSYKAMTLIPGDGVMPGSYKVAVRKMTEPPANGSDPVARPEGSDVDDKDADAESAKNSRLKDEVQDLLPMQYASPMTSGLTVTVEKGTATYDIELK